MAVLTEKEVSYEVQAGCSVKDACDELYTEIFNDENINEVRININGIHIVMSKEIIF